MYHAFDPGVSLGWATWGPSAQRPETRIINLKSDSEGAVYSRARTKLCEIIQRGDDVAVEAPVLPRGPISIRSRLVLFGIRALIFGVAYDRQARIREVEPSAWRSHYLGCTQAPKEVKGSERRRRWIKAKTKQAAVDRGWGEVSEDEADALGILDYLRCKADPSYAVRATPLFAGLT